MLSECGALGRAAEYLDRVCHAPIYCNFYKNKEIEKSFFFLTHKTFVRESTEKKRKGRPLRSSFLLCQKLRSRHFTAIWGL